MNLFSCHLISNEASKRLVKNFNLSDNCELTLFELKAPDLYTATYISCFLSPPSEFSGSATDYTWQAYNSAYKILHYTYKNIFDIITLIN